MGDTGLEVEFIPADYAVPILAEKPGDWARELAGGVKVETGQYWLKLRHGDRIVVIYGRYRPYKVGIYDPEVSDNPRFEEVHDLRLIKGEVFRWLIQGLQ